MEIASMVDEPTYGIWTMTYLIVIRLWFTIKRFFLHAITYKEQPQAFIGTFIGASQGYTCLLWKWSLS